MTKKVKSQIDKVKEALLTANKVHFAEGFLWGRGYGEKRIDDEKKFNKDMNAAFRKSRIPWRVPKPLA